MEQAAYASLAALEKDHWWFRGRREIIRSEIRRLNPPSTAKILEAGCGSGGNLALLAEFGAVSAFEPDDSARDNAVRKGVGTVLPGSLPNGIPESFRGFDIIGAFDVIEHIHKDQDAIRNLAALLNPGGHLIMTMPAHPWMWTRHDEIHGHVRRYRKSDLLERIKQSGLTLHRCSYFNSLLFPVIACIRAIQRWTNHAKSASGDMTMPPNWLNSLLSAAFSIESKILGFADLTFGVSLLVIAQQTGSK